MTTQLYVPGTAETDQTKLIMSQQLVAGQTATNTDSIATNTAAIATLNAANYVNTIAGNHGAFTLNATSGITNSTNDILLSQGSSSQFGAVKVDNTTIKATAGVISQSLGNATSQASPANPTGTTSTTGVMMGLGSSCTITPVYGTRVLIQFNFTIQNSGTSAQTSQLKFGTSTAPTNGAAATGTNVGKARQVSIGVAGAPLAMTQSGIITGLTPGTAYWFDLDVFGAANTTTVKDVDFNAMEF